MMDSFPQIFCTIKQVNNSCKHIRVFGLQIINVIGSWKCINVPVGCCKCCLHFEYLQVQGIYSLYQRIYGFFFADNADMIIDAGTHEVILLYHSASKNACLDLFAFSIGDSETNGWIFMFVAHDNAPFILGVAAGIVDSLTVSWIYSL